MEKRMMLAIALSIAVLIGYQYFYSPPPPPPAPAGVAAGKDDGATVPPVSAPSAKGAPAPAPASVAGGLAAKTAVSGRTITVKTPLYTASLATEGGGVSSFLLSGYKDAPGPTGAPLDILGGKVPLQPTLSLYLDEDRPPLPSPLAFSSDAPAMIAVKAGETRSVLLTWESTTGVRVSREYVFHGDKYEFEARVQTTNGSREPVEVRPGLELDQVYEGELAGDSYSFHGIVVGSGKSGLTRYDLKDISKGKVEKGPARWIAADAKYFTWILLPEREWTVTRASLTGETRARVAAADTAAILQPGDTVRAGARVFAGPKQTALLEATGKDLPDLIDFGWFAVVAKPLVFLMKASNRVTGNYGIDIILLTILIKILFYPLTQKSIVSMKKMQELGPIIKTLKEKYKGDTQRLNQETMNLYKTYKINPLSGCLPMVAQIPVFIALYKGLLVTIELRHAPFFLWINDLSAPEHLWNIAVAGYDLPIRLLPLLMGVSMFLQQKMTPSAGMEPMQQKMMLFMPLIFTFMFWSFPTGLVIYWLVNNILAIGQQMIYNRKADAAKAATA
ncbi:MAG: membrane protein insertase YidC [Deltaproteobacteria bacterium]|nr:MAG: membrane protein insertase YidC [Deltaproteobacteria bacterium]